MVRLQIEHEGLHFLIRFLPRELSDIYERLDQAIASGAADDEVSLTGEENACARLIAACQNALDDELRKSPSKFRRGDP